MPFIKRNTKGHVVSISKEAEDGDQEYLPSGHEDIRAFLQADTSHIEDPHLALDETDRDIARITEDLIHLLVQKNIILFTELPTPVQRKVLAREALRSMIGDDVNNFLEEEDGF